MTEYRACTITDEQQQFLKTNNINLSWLTQKAINQAMCKRIVTIRPEQRDWLNGVHVNLNILVQAAIDKEMNGHD